MQISIEHKTRQGRAFTTPAIWSEQHRLRTKAGVTQEFEWPVTRVQNQPPSSARSRSHEMVDRWNDIGNKLIAMAQDFPEDQHDFKVQKDERTFALPSLALYSLPS